MAHEIYVKRLQDEMESYLREKFGYRHNEDTDDTINFGQWKAIILALMESAYDRRAEDWYGR